MQATAEAPSTTAPQPNIDHLVNVPATTLPNGVVVPAFQVGAYHCSQSPDGLAVINPDNTPWARINFHKAKQACIDAGFSLITELQYLAIAYQITQQDANWTGGSVGEGELYRGIHKYANDEAQNGHYVSDVITERRWHGLANGERVYDFSGNIYSWVFDDVQGDENGIVAAPFARDSASLTTAPYPSREKGIGWYPQFDDEDEVIDWSGNALIRGGYWRSGDYAGVFYLYYDWPHVDYVSVGFRCTKSL
jgi:hypothetical protein